MKKGPKLEHAADGSWIAAIFERTTTGDAWDRTLAKMQAYREVRPDAHTIVDVRAIEQFDVGPATMRDLAATSVAWDETHDAPRDGSRSWRRRASAMRSLVNTRLGGAPTGPRSGSSPIEPRPRPGYPSRITRHRAGSDERSVRSEQGASGGARRIDPEQRALKYGVRP